MIQTAGDKGATVTASVAKDASETAPLQGRVSTLEAEMNSLDTRVGALQEALGYSGSAVAGGGEAGVAEVQVDTKQEISYAKYTQLLHSFQDLSALKDDVATLEGRAAGLKSSVLALENQVSGNAFEVKDASLLSKGVKGAAIAKEGAKTSESSLKSRVEALEDETEGMRTRVTSLEQMVVGLQVKAE
jgi:uncharacterized protein YceH (UPF0502 family)